jgi:hypothetical protein
VTVCGATAVAAFVEPGRRGRAIGAYGLAIAAPQVVLTPAAPWLAERVGFGFVFVLAVLPALAIPLAWPIARAVGDSDRAPADGDGDGAGDGAAAALWRAVSGPVAALVVITASGGAILTFTPRILVSPALGFAGLLAFTGAAAASRWGAGGIADRFGATAAIAPLLFTGALGPAAGEAARSSVSIAWNLSFDAGTGLGAFTAGAIATATSYSVAFIVLALAVGIVAGCWQLPRFTRQSQEKLQK